MRFIFICFILFILGPVLHAQSQNLIKNPSFEVFDNCPEEMGSVTKDVAHWSRATKGTSDYFNECSYDMGIPNNFNGKQSAAFGTGYAGMYLLAPSNYREYLQGELTQTLEKDKRYGISFYVSLSDKSIYAIRDIGVLFSAEHLDLPDTKVISRNNEVLKKTNNNYNYKEVSDYNYFDDKEGWMKVYVEITAKGTENFITLGNFKDDSRTQTKKIKGVKSAAYYYVDMISVQPIETNYAYRNLKLNKVYSFKNVMFSSNNYFLDNKSKSDLRTLYNQLKRKPELYITIHAHTDAVGAKGFNRNLSVKRAQNVANYLKKLGLKENRIQWYGHGEKKPVAANATVEGKSMNRRAEFVLSNSKLTPNLSRSSYAETRFEEDN